MQRYYGQPYAPVDDPATRADRNSYPAADDHQALDPGSRDHLPSQYEYPSTSTQHLNEPSDVHYDNGNHNHASFSQPSSYEPYRQPQSQRQPALYTPFPPQHRSKHPAPPPEDLGYNPAQRRNQGSWSRRKKLIVWGSVGAVVFIIALAVGLGVGLSRATSFNWSPSTAHVTNAQAFSEGGATHNSVSDTSDGIGAGQDVYTYHSGDETVFPKNSQWVSFENMWMNNLEVLQTSCKTLDAGPNNTPEIIQYIYDAIQNRAAVSLVDHRFIFAVILQESKGCVRVGTTTSSGGVTNPGLMQSHNGHTYSPSHSNESIVAMIQDGTQGTFAGDGLVQNLNVYANPYKAARGYNSGFIPASGNLSQAAGATACYVSDVANRLTGWVWAKSTCPGDMV